MKKLPREKLSYDDFRRIIAITEKRDPRYAQFYELTHKHGEHVLFESRDIEGPPEGRMLADPNTYEVHIRFIDCHLSSMQLMNNIKSVSIEDCDTGEIHVLNCTLTSFSITGEQSVPLIALHHSSIENCVIDVSLEKLQLKASGANSRTTLLLQRPVQQLMIEDFQAVITATAHIGDCQVISSPYPFYGFTVIRNMTLRRLMPPSTRVQGIFENVTLSEWVPPLIFYHFICLNTFKIGSVSVRASGLLDGLEIEGGFIHTLDTNHFNGKLKMRIYDVNDQHLYINRVDIKHFSSDLILHSNTQEKVVHINTIRLKDVYIHKENRIEMTGVALRSLEWDDLRNEGTFVVMSLQSGQFSFDPVTFDELLSKECRDPHEAKKLINAQAIDADRNEMILRLCDLGRLNFINSDFSSFTLYIHSTKLNDIFLAGSRMPKKVKSDTLLQERVAYAQLKKLHDQHGDQVAAAEYFAEEMNAYYKSIRFRKDPSEKIALFFNRISSNHGTSWSLALTITLGSSFIFYWLFCLSLGYTLNWRHSGHWYTFVDLMSYILHFINPLHKLEDFKPLSATEDFSGWTRFIDGASRIFIAYFVYQLIQAFRKHGKTK